MVPQEGGRPVRRDELLAGAVDYVLAHGVTGLSLRPLARALGTSDRMLLYYFGTREALVAAVLRAVADRLRSLLGASLPAERQPPAALLATALTVANDEAAPPLLRLWLQVVALADRDPAFAETASAVLDDWVGWFAERVDVPPEQQRAAAAALLVVVDGLVLFDAAGARADTEAAAGWLLAALAATTGSGTSSA